MFDINPHSPHPIWDQIRFAFLKALISGQLKPNSTVPSVRELAQKLRVNPNTVARAYRELQRDGILVTRKGLGTFIAPDALDSPLLSQTFELESLLNDVVQIAKFLGVPLEDIQKILQKLWNNSTPNGGAS